MSDIDEIRAALDYCPKTGRLTWRERPLRHFKTPAARASWNKRFAGKPGITAVLNGYLIGTFCRKQYYAHRLAWAIIHGEWPECIDHINGDRSDNRLANLRNVTRAQNLRNIGPRRGGTSRFKGVSWDAEGAQWRAAARDRDGKKRYLGRFLEEKDAARAHDAFVSVEHGEFAWLNRA